MKVDKEQYTKQSYWDKLLKDFGLSMERGRSARVSYVGGATEVERIHGEQETKDGRVLPDKPRKSIPFSSLQKPSK
jgi:hypothetical protein